MSEMESTMQAIPIDEVRESVGLWSRFAARIVDWVILFFIVFLPFHLDFLGKVNLDLFGYCATSRAASMECTEIWSEYRQSLLLSYAISIVVSMAYFAFFTISNRRGTPGKQIFKLQVVDFRGQKLTLAQSFLRHLPWSLINILGFLLVFFAFDGYKELPVDQYLGALFNFTVAFQIGLTEHRQGWHDELAGTFVIQQNTKT
jgi:uncharacterized RDD family membrane protein YckC